MRFCLVLLVWLPVARALTLVPELNLNLSQLTPEQRAELFDLENRLTDYLSTVDWDPEESGTTLRVPVAIQVRSAMETGSATEYMGLFATGNKSDYSLDDPSWRFRVPDGRFDHNEDSFDSFLSLIDFHVLVVLGHEYDKRSEFGGNAFFERARRVGSQAMFSEQQLGWDRRTQQLDELLDLRNKDFRTLRWVTHTALWFRTVQASPYDSWKSARLALDMAERIDNPTQLSPWYKANFRALIEIFEQGKDEDSLDRLLRMDNLDPQRTEAYRDAISRLNR